MNLMAMIVSFWVTAKKYAKSYTDAAISIIPNGFLYKGAVAYYADLPASADVGDTYTVQYKGESGTDADGTEYAWGPVGGVNQWIALGPKIQGEKGEKGGKGDKGDTGATGAQGAKGDTGEAGPQGAPGVTGAKGDTGETGAQGDPGDAATIAVGTVTTGDAGTSAAITNSGTSSAAVFDFTIPQGAQGAKGDTGAGVNSGGSAGQVMKKASATDYDTAWGDIATDVSATLTTAGWTGASAPFYQDVAINGVTSGSKLDVGCAAGLTATQYAAAVSAQLAAYSAGTDSVRIYAYGAKPTVAIPILIRVVG